MKIGILIPAFNEEKTIGKVIKDVKKHLPDSVVVVVDDGSTDRTAELAETEGAKVIVHRKNKGKGEALKSGFRYLKSIDVDSVVIMDADGQYSASDIPKLLFPLSKGSDIVMGFRNFKKIPLRHRLGNIVWRFFFNLLFGTRLKDTNCGFMALSKKALKLLRNVHGGYIIENSILSEAVKRKMEITQVPVSVKYREISSIPRGLRVVFGVLLFIIKEGIKYRLGVA
ncbi:MAG: glycosyltransferase family 2 protein [Candidatus Micrarchaeota archaeon]|nr:glycosyltransferase family 2 protein [Candidatus Micrarchaeota archaeon]